MNCPICAVELVDTDPGQHGCPKCHGTWLSHASFEQFVHVAGFDHGRDVVMTEELTKRAPRTCPICAAPMVAGTVFAVLVDRCATDGVWADAGELSRIVLALRRR